MGLETSGSNKVVKGAVFAAALLAALLANQGCKTNSNGEKGDEFVPSTPYPKHFPQCGPDAEEVTVFQKRYGRFGVIAPPSVPPEVPECVEDEILKRDCSAVRRTARMRINLIPGLFECKDGKPIFTGRFTDHTGKGEDKEIPIPFTNLLEEIEGVKGDCRDVRMQAENKIRRALSPGEIECDKGGVPHIKILDIDRF